MADQSSTSLQDADSERDGLLEELRQQREALRKQAEELAEERRFLAGILDNLPTAIAYLDRDLVYRYCNLAKARFLGRSIDQVLHHSIRELVPDQPPVWQVIEQVIETGEPYWNWDLAIALPGQDGEGPRHFMAACLPDREDGGTVKGVFALDQEVTQLVQLQEALRESEETCQSFIASAWDGIALTNERGAIIEWNHGAELVTGLKREDVLGRPEWEVQFQVAIPERHTPEAYDHLKSGYRSFFATGEAPWLNRVTEAPYRRTDGVERVMQQTVFAIRTDRGHRLAAIMRDITEHKQVEAERERLLEQLRQANEQLANATARAEAQTEAAQTRAEELDAVLNAIDDGLVLYEPETDTLHVNRQTLRILGFTSEQWEGLSPEERVVSLHMQTPEGQPIPMEQTPRARALRGETITGYRMTVQRPDGRTVHLLTSTTPVQDALGRIQGVISTLTDISELQRLQEEREDFIRAISHDLRNPLTPLVGMADLLGRQLRQKGMEVEANSASLIERSARRMNAMIQDLVDSTRLEAGKMELHQEPVDLSLFLSDLLSRLGTEADRARLRLAAPEWVPPVKADPGQLERAVANLISNALKYSPPEEPVLIHTDRVKEEAVISVRDQGVGIPSEEVPLIFERYFRARTGRTTEGLGLGLYITRLIAEAHGGRIWVESEVGKGSTFSIGLPLSAE